MLLPAAVLLVAAQPSLEPRVAALEAKVADLQARVSALEGSTLAFSDDFAAWDPSRYFVYPSTWRDTSGNGTYSPDIISASGGLLNIAIRTENGVRKVAAFCPLPSGSLSNRGDLLGMRVEFRIRADRMLGYKGVPLLWPMSGVWPRDGEINWPESTFDKTPSAFMHRQGATASNDQDWYPAPAGTSWQDWHTYAIDWQPGVSAEFFIDGRSIGKSTSRVPNTAMHLVMQFETNLDGYVPDPAVAGRVQIDYLRVWS